LATIEAIGAGEFSKPRAPRPGGALRLLRRSDKLAWESPPMREFFWGVVWGALAVYLYANYGDQLHRFKRYVDTNRDWAVKQSDGYATGRDKKK
jgi:hypothetical protein